MSDLLPIGTKVSIKAPGCDEAHGVVSGQKSGGVSIAFTEPGERPYSLMFYKGEDGQYREPGRNRFAPSLSVQEGK